MINVSITDLYDCLETAEQIMENCFSDYQRVEFTKIEWARARYFYGQVRYNWRTQQWTLRVSKPVFSNFDTVQHMRAKLINTLIHELIHTCPGCLNHGVNFKHRCSTIYRLTGLVIKRTTSFEEVEGLNAEQLRTQKRPAKYEVYCPHCQQVIAERTKYSKVCSQISRYRCSLCGCNKLELRIK